MPSINDVFNELQQVNTELTTLHSDMVNTNNILSQNLQSILQQNYYSNLAAVHLSEQNSAIICLLEKISQWTCAILNEEHVQTGLQTSIMESDAELLELYKLDHGRAAAELEKFEKLRKEILECCPPKNDPPKCSDHHPCKTPKELPEPPSITGTFIE
jgi:hypothetical protein